MTFQQAHQRLDPVKSLQLLGSCHQTECAAVSKGIAAGTDLFGHPSKCFGEA